MESFGHVDGGPLLDIDPGGLQRRLGDAPVIRMFPRIGPTLPPPNPQVGTTRHLLKCGLDQIRLAESMVALSRGTLS